VLITLPQLHRNADIRQLTLQPSNTKSPTTTTTYSIIKYTIYYHHYNLLISNKSSTRSTGDQLFGRTRFEIEHQNIEHYHLHLNYAAMSQPKLPLDILLMIARLLTDEDGEICFADFNSFLKVNCELYNLLNPKLWKAAVKSKPMSALVFAHFIRRNDLPTLKKFLDFGADVDTHLKVFFHGPILKDVYNSASGPSIIRLTPLEVASTFDIPAMARLFLQHGAKIVIRVQNRLTHSALHFARTGEMVQLLLDHGANPNEQTAERYVPLHHYAMRQDLDAMRVILSQGARVDVPAGFLSHTPLHEAAQRSVEAVKLLLEHGANAEARGSDWHTPLFEAVNAGKADVVKLLVEYSPDGVTKTDPWGRTPLQSAVWYRRTDVVRVLQELGVRL
jgi:hypothetical protein